jgi:hypothetical protein
MVKTKSTRPHSVSKPNKVRIFYIDIPAEETYARLAFGRRGKDNDLLNDVVEYCKTSLVMNIPVLMRGEPIGYITATEGDVIELLQLRTHSKFREDIVVRGKLEVKKTEEGHYIAEIVLLNLH